MLGFCFAAHTFRANIFIVRHGGLRVRLGLLVGGAILEILGIFTDTYGQIPIFAYRVFLDSAISG